MQQQLDKQIAFCKGKRKKKKKTTQPVKLAQQAAADTTRYKLNRSIADRTGMRVCMQSAQAVQAAVPNKLRNKQ